MSDKIEDNMVRLAIAIGSETNEKKRRTQNASSYERQPQG